MALVTGRKPFGAAGMTFGEPGGTFGNMWEGGDPFYDVLLSGGGQALIDPDLTEGFETVVEYEVDMHGGGEAEVILIRIIKYTGTPNRVLQVSGSAPTVAVLRSPT